MYVTGLVLASDSSIRDNENAMGPTVWHEIIAGVYFAD